MLELYLIGSAWTAFALFESNRPHGVEWLPFVVFSAFWPLWWLFVIAGSIRRGWKDAAP